MGVFSVYAAKAGEGRNSLPRLVAGSLLVVVCWFAVTFAGLIALELWFAPPAAKRDGPIGSSALDPFLTSPTGVVALLLTFAAIWLGVWLSLRFVHRRSFAGVLGVENRVSWPDFGKAAVAAILVAAALSSIALAFEPRLQRNDLPLDAWIAGLAPIAVAILVQSSAEELLFRGYLQQSLAHLYRSPLIWAAVPTTLFTLGHWYPDTLLHVNVALLIATCAFSIGLTILVVRTGNLGAAMGAHFGNNLVALLYVSPADAVFPAPSLFEAPALQDPRWTITDAAAVALEGIVISVLMLLLLLHRRSPLRLVRS